MPWCFEAELQLEKVSLKAGGKEPRLCFREQRVQLGRVKGWEDRGAPDAPRSKFSL